MLYQVILTGNDLELLHKSLDAAVEHYVEYLEHKRVREVRQLVHTIDLTTYEMKWRSNHENRN